MTARGQTSYSHDPTAGLAGKLDATGPKYDISAVSSEASAAMRFGVFVKGDPSNEKGVLLLTGLTDLPVGPTGYHRNYDRLQELDDTTGGIKPGVDVSIRQMGRIWVRVEGTIKKFDRAFVRAVSGAGGTVLGVARATAVDGETIDCSPLGYFDGPDDGGTTPERFAPFLVGGLLAPVNPSLRGPDQEIVTAGATAVSLLTPTTRADGNAAGNNITSTLADGLFPGQRKLLVLSKITSAKTWVVTPTHFVDGTTVTLSAARDTALLEWNALLTKWFVAGLTGSSAVA